MAMTDVFVNWVRDIIDNDPDIKGGSGWTTQYFKDYDKEINDYFMTREQDYNREMAKLAQDYNVFNMKLQQDFERTMSSTAYQRAMADMQAAGLNPASMVGSSAVGASTPSSGLASNSAASVRAPYVSGYHPSQKNSANSGGLFDGIFSSVLSSSKDARKKALNELEDNAKEIHKQDEKVESLKQKQLDANIAKWEKYKNG